MQLLHFECFGLSGRHHWMMDRGALTSPCNTWVVAFLLMTPPPCRGPPPPPPLAGVPPSPTGGPSPLPGPQGGCLSICILQCFCIIIVIIFVGIHHRCGVRYTHANFEISTSFAWLFFKFQSRASEYDILPGMNPSTCRRLYVQSSSTIKSSGPLFGPLGECLKICARHETWNGRF